MEENQTVATDEELEAELNALEEKEFPENLERVENSVILKAKEGDEAAFEELFMATYKYVLSVVMSYLKNDRDAYDAVQETYTKVYKGLPDLKSVEAFYGWLRRIAANCAIDILRELRRNRADEWDEEIKDAAEEKDRDLSIDICNVLQALPKEQVELLVRVYYDRMTVAEIARMQNLPYSTVRDRIKAAKKALVAELRLKGIDKPIYGGSLFAMIANAFRHLIGTELLSMSVAQEILGKVTGKKTKSAVVLEKMLRRERNSAVLKVAGIVVLACLVFSLLIVGGIQLLKYFKRLPSEKEGGEGASSSQTSKPTDGGLSGTFDPLKEIFGQENTASAESSSQTEIWPSNKKPAKPSENNDQEPSTSVDKTPSGEDDPPSNDAPLEENTPSGGTDETEQSPVVKDEPFVTTGGVITYGYSCNTELHETYLNETAVTKEGSYAFTRFWQPTDAPYPTLSTKLPPASAATGNGSRPAHLPTGLGLVKHDGMIYYALSEDGLYNGYVIKRYNPKTNKTERVVDVPYHPSHLGIIDNRLYWNDDGYIYSCKTDGTDIRIMSKAKEYPHSDMGEFYFEGYYVYTSWYIINMRDNTYTKTPIDSVRAVYGGKLYGGHEGKIVSYDLASGKISVITDSDIDGIDVFEDVIVISKRLSYSSSQIQVFDRKTEKLIKAVNTNGKVYKCGYENGEILLYRCDNSTNTLSDVLKIYLDTANEKTSPISTGHSAPYYCTNIYSFKDDDYFYMYNETGEVLYRYSYDFKTVKELK